MSAGKRRARPGLHRPALVAGQPDEHARGAQALETRDRIRIEVDPLVVEPLPDAERPLDAEVVPERPVVFASLDRHAERREHDVRLETGCAGHLAPDPLLVDERLADVEEDRANRHLGLGLGLGLGLRACEQPLDEREIVDGRDLREPRIAGDDADPAAGALDSDAQSVAPARSPAYAARSRSARKACGVWTATSSSRGTVSTTTPRSTRLTVSRSGSPGTTPSTPSASPPSSALEDGVVDERPRGVVHEHDERVVGDLGERVPDGLGARRAARHDRRRPSRRRAPRRGGSSAPPTPAAPRRRVASIQSERSSRSRLSARSGRPPRPTNAFGWSPPSLEPEPAATRIAHVVPAAPEPLEEPGATAARGV